MGDPLSQTMDKPCEICGHVGWVDPLTVCSKCNITREHLYCMRILYDGEPEKWICEECDSSSQIPSSKPAPSKQPSGTGVRYMIKKPPQNSKVQYLTPEEAIVLESGAMRSNWSSPPNYSFARRSSVNKPTVSTPPPKFRIKSNPPVGPSGCRELLNDWSMPSGSKDKKISPSTEVKNSVFQKDNAWQESSVSGRYLARNMQTSNTMKQKEIDVTSQQRCGESPIAKRMTFEELPTHATEKGNINSGLSSVQLGPRLPAVISGRLAQQFGKNTPTVKHLPDGTKDNVNSGRTSHLVQPFPTVTSGIDVCTEARPKKINSKGMESLRVTMLLDNYLPNHPSVSPTWKGTFQITNDIKPCIFDEIEAYPPCKVHRKVYKVSKQFPKTLSFKLLPRRDSWVEFFEDNVPGGLDIGLYFLSSSYCSLLEYLDEHDLLLRACFDEVELFVFSSRHLREDSRKIHQKYFLWGVLRPFEASKVTSKEILLAQKSEVNDKHSEPSRVESLVRLDAMNYSNSQQVQQSMSEEPEAQDMDVDMLGGHELDNIDRVVPKPTDIACGDRIQGEIEPSNEVKTSPKSLEGEILESAPVKIKREWDDGHMEASLPSSYEKSVEDTEWELEFEKELQRSFDDFTALLQKKEAGCLRRDAKVEPDALRAGSLTP